MVSFVHPGKNSLVSFGSGVFCPTFLQPNDATSDLHARRVKCCATYFVFVVMFWSY